MPNRFTAVAEKAWAMAEQRRHGTPMSTSLSRAGITAKPKINLCIDCGTKIIKTSTRCRECMSLVARGRLYRGSA